jgi:hypothetical protein
MSKRKARRILSISGLAAALLVPPLVGNGAFSLGGFNATLWNPTDGSSYIQGEAITFSSDHQGWINFTPENYWQSAGIRAVVGYIDPPGHEQVMNPYHVVKEVFTYGTYPPNTGPGELTMGWPTTQWLSDQAGVDWVGQYTAFAKTNYRLNYGAWQTPTGG